MLRQPVSFRFVRNQCCLTAAVLKNIDKKVLPTFLAVFVKTKETCFFRLDCIIFLVTLDRVFIDFSLDSGAWRTKRFKAYNFNALGQRIDSGHLHPLLKVRTQFRQILLEMGSVFCVRNWPHMHEHFMYLRFCFLSASVRCPPTGLLRVVSGTSMRSSNRSSILRATPTTLSSSVVRSQRFKILLPFLRHSKYRSSNMFCSGPETSNNFPREYMERVKMVHSKGGYGSQGWVKCIIIKE